MLSFHAFKRFREPDCQEFEITIEIELDYELEIPRPTIVKPGPGKALVSEINS